MSQHRKKLTILFGVISTTLIVLLVCSHAKTRQHNQIPQYLRPFRPIPIRIINIIGVALDIAGLLDKAIPLDSNSLIKKACKKLSDDATGTNCILQNDAPEEFGGDFWKTSLDKLMLSLRDEAKLSMLGRIIAHEQIIGVLETRGKLLKMFQDNPSIANEPTRDPIFIVGFPRTGTTFLQRLLAIDPANRSPTLWEYIAPVPRPPPPPPVNASKADMDAYNEETRKTIAEEQYKVDQYKQLAPGFDAIHPVEATNPEECIIAMNYAMEAMQFGATYPVHSYLIWLFNLPDHKPALRFHRRILQHLQQGDSFGKRRWVIKTPYFLSMLDDIRKVHPNAKIIHTHREPAQSIASLSSVIAKMHGIVSDDIDLHKIASEQLMIYKTLLNRAMKVRKEWAKVEKETNPSHSINNNGSDSFRIFDVHLQDLQLDPIGTVHSIYKDFFGIDLETSTAHLMREWLDQNSRDKHGDHRPTMSHFGLEDKMEDELLQEYREIFDVKVAASLPPSKRSQDVNNVVKNEEL